MTPNVVTMRHFLQILSHSVHIQSDNEAVIL